MPYGRKRTRPFDFQDKIHNQSQPEIIGFLNRVRALTDSYEGRFTVAEVGGEGARVAELSVTGDEVCSPTSRPARPAPTKSVETRLPPSCTPTTVRAWAGRAHSVIAAQAATAARRAVTAAMDALDEEEPADEEPALYYGSVDEFVREYLVKNYRRRVDGERTVARRLEQRGVGEIASGHGAQAYRRRP